MAEVRLAARRREATGKGAARKARAAGRVPAVLYGRGIEPLSIEVDRRELVTAFHTDAGTNVLLDLQIDGQSVLAIARELQRDPVKGTLLHADFIKVDRTQEIEVEVPVHLVGESPGVKEGGVLEQQLHAVSLRCPVTAVPEAIEVDVGSLGIGDALRVGDLPTGDYTLLADPEEVVATVAAPVSEEEVEALEAAAGIERPPSEEEAEEAPGTAAPEQPPGSE